VAPHDADVLELTGWIAETQALESEVRGRRKDADRYRGYAEGELRAALDADPARFEARLRLGHLLLAAGRAEEAEPLLREALTQATDARQRYLASLFLGRACDRQGRSMEAIEAYRGALAAWPDSQAARLALGQAMEPRSGPGEARDLVAASLADSTRDDREPDPWWSYPFGRRDEAKASLDRLWAEVLRP
jgi:tetratricopeptide (TPR) repeat protein